MTPLELAQAKLAAVKANRVKAQNDVVTFTYAEAQLSALVQEIQAA